ncbi:MAG: nucleotidyltransferase domain-containing protein [Spirochaetota bacterium]
MPIDELADPIRRDVDKAIEILTRFGAAEVYLFGSVLTGSADSGTGDIDIDIDIAVTGLSPRKFFAARGQLAMQLIHEFDLVDLDDASVFVETLRRSGRLERVA